MFFVYLSIIIRVGLVIHVIKTQRPWYWIWLLLIFPLIGGLAYFVLEIMPDLRRGRSFDGVADGLRDMVVPARKIASLEEELEISPTMHNRQALAEAYADAGRYDESIALMQECLSGAYKDDPDLLMLLAEILMEAEQYQEVQQTLLRVEEVKPRHKPTERGLLLARTHEGLGNKDAALKAYEAILPLFSGEEARCRYAKLLDELDRHDEADEIYTEIVRNVKRSPGYYRRAQRHWYNIAKSKVK